MKKLLVILLICAYIIVGCSGSKEKADGIPEDFFNETVVTLDNLSESLKVKYDLEENKRNQMNEYFQKYSQAELPENEAEIRDRMVALKLVLGLHLTGTDGIPKKFSKKKKELEKLLYK